MARQERSRDGAPAVAVPFAFHNHQQDFDIVGVSAGGLEALEVFFDNMSADSGLAFVVFPHHSPDIESRMDELLARHTQIAIHRVQDGMVVEPNSIYLIPPKKKMIISGATLLLADRDPSDGPSALDNDLQYVRANLQATMQEMETTNQELQATNEELVASNEGLRRTNEKLHSVNQGLNTVNAEHQRKIRELTVLTDDMDNLFRSIDVGTIFLDRELRIRKFTPEISKTFQILPQDIGRRIDGFAHNLLYDQLYGDVASVMKSATQLDREVRDRQDNWFLVRLLPYYSEAGVDGVVLSLIDVSHLKETQNQLRLMFNVFQDAADPIIIEDLAGHILDVNSVGERVFGWQRDELLGEKTTILIPDATRKEIAKLRTRCRRSEHVRDVETYLRHKSGKTLPISLTLSRLSDATTVPVAVAWIAKDITRRHRAEKQRERYAARLESTNQQLRENVEKRKAAEAKAREHARRRDEFLAMLSHELRNPMGALLHATRVLDRVLPDETGKEPRRVVQRQARQMARLLDDLLDVSRVTQGKIEIRWEVVDLVSLVDDALSAVQPMIETRRHQLTVDLPQEALCVEGDPSRLLQVIENLLINAAKYTSTGGNIGLRLRRSGEMAEICVCDDGIGIPSEMLDRIFELFVQSDSTADGSGGGMGVGLTLVKHLVELHGGTVTATSCGKNHGSTFTVRLALTKKPLAATEEEPFPPADENSTKVVLVEDNSDAREMLKSLLELDGYQVVAAEDGKSGVAAILAECPHIAIIDIGLPELDGLEVARQVRASSLDHRVYLVALTGYGQQQDRVAVREAGFDQHLVKPVEATELARVLTVRPKIR